MLKAVCGILAVRALTAGTPEPSCALVAGSSPQGTARAYDAGNLFEYMDGNAEGYLLYGFQNMRGVSCLRDGVTFVIDISDMGDPDSAYGMFAANRDPRLATEQLGMGGQVTARRAIFAKGKYFIEAAANPDGDHTAALRQWASALDAAVPGAASPPPVLSWFPPEGQQSLRLVPESVLGLRVLRRGYVAQYEFGKAFLALEETTGSAETVFRKLRARFPDARAAKTADEAFAASDPYLGRLCVFRMGRYLGGFANVSNSRDPAALASALAARIGAEGKTP